MGRWRILCIALIPTSVSVVVVYYYVYEPSVRCARDVMVSLLPDLSIFVFPRRRDVCAHGRLCQDDSGRDGWVSDCLSLSVSSH